MVRSTEVQSRATCGGQSWAAKVLFVVNDNLGSEGQNSAQARRVLQAAGRRAQTGRMFRRTEEHASGMRGWRLGGESSRRIVLVKMERTRKIS